jgi:muramoyltetrapeptide carboxypeptidase
MVAAGMAMKLSAGDRVCVIAPASQFRGVDRTLLTQAVSLLESWNLRVDVRVDDRHHFYLAGTDLVRAGHLNDALADASVKAIFCTRGGYGSARLLTHIDTRLTPAPKFLVGHSDITSLHVAVSGLWPQIISVHGPNVATRQLLGTDEFCERNRQSLRKALFADRDFCEPVEFLRPGVGRGPLQGGCLSLVVAAVGTPFSTPTFGSILFLEDTSEPPYRVDRMISQLMNAGMLENVRGVVFGTMNECTDPYNNIRDVLRDLFNSAPYPVAFGFRSGHGNINISVHLGAPVELDGGSGTLRTIAP